MFHEAVVVCVMGLQSLLGAAPDGPGLSPEQAKDNVILSASKTAKASADAGVAVPEKKAPAAAKTETDGGVAAPAKAMAAPMTPEVKDLVDRMQAFYEKTQDFTADFQQVYAYKTFKRVSRSTGKVTYQKPSLPAGVSSGNGPRMRWEYETQDGKPAPRTFVLAGDRVYAYDPGAKLLTRAAIATNQLSASVTFLWGQGKLADEFSIATAACDKCTGTLLELTPLVPDPRFKRVKLEVDPKTAQVIRSIVVDPDGSENAITFLKMVTNTGVDEKTFKLSPPPGTQVQDFLPKQ